MVSGQTHGGRQFPPPLRGRERSDWPRHSGNTNRACQGSRDGRSRWSMGGALTDTGSRPLTWHWLCPACTLAIGTQTCAPGCTDRICSGGATCIAEGPPSRSWTAGAHVLDNRRLQTDRAHYLRSKENKNRTFWKSTKGGIRYVSSDRSPNLDHYCSTDRCNAQNIGMV